LAAFGLSPLATNTPLAPVEPPAMWGLLAWTRRQSAQTALNQAPTTVANPTQNSLVAAPVDVVEPAVAATVPVPGTTMPVTSANVVTGSIPGVLSASGVNPAVSTTAAAPVQAPAAPSGPASLLQILQYTFFNQPPTANPAQSPGQSAAAVITGNLNASGPNGAPLTYTVTQNPAQGSVVVNPDGSYTYTPNADLANYGGTDQFTVSIDDGSAYRQTGVVGVIQGWVHSFAQAIGLSGPDTITANVTVNVAPAQDLSLLFTRTVLVSGLDTTDFGFLPDGRILIAEKSGAILAYNNNTGQLQSQPLITLPTRSDDIGRGLLGIAVDPNFTNNGYIYVTRISPDNHERLSRLTVTDPSAGVLTADPASEVVLLQGDQPAADDHFAGAIRFGPDGKLYWSVGDNGFYVNSPQIFTNAQDLSNMYGKILRLNPDGTVPADNPFVNTPGADPYIYAYGFRNPFRMTFTPDGKLLVADVGQGTWEELDIVTAGGNYGWPLAEGVCPGAGVCAPGVTAGQFVNPIYAYNHNGASAAITSVLVYTGSTFGTSFQNKVFIADFAQGWIKELTCNSDFSSCGSERMFDPGTQVFGSGPVELLQGPDGNIYELQVFSGDLSRITPSGDGLPIAQG
jgi:glucose/arabinose dehydrogenase